LPGSPSDQVRSIVESEIIPRLALAHGLASGASGGRPVSSAPPSRIDLPDVDDFTSLVLCADFSDLAERVDALLLAGIAVEDLFGRVLAPTARRLGVYWDQDIVSFSDVTVALGKLQHLVRAFSRPDVNGPGAGRTMLIGTAPGEQHSLGVAIIADAFRSARWSVSEALGASVADLVRMVARTRFDVLGLSVASRSGLADAPVLIRTLRAASLNRRLVVLAGGFAVSAYPELAMSSGADAIASDGPGALAKAAELLDAHAARV
jgi:methanogenic corrinoid protein MtbC1